MADSNPRRRLIGQPPNRVPDDDAVVFRQSVTG